MKIYARIQDGVVAEIILPATYDSDGEFDGVSYHEGDEISIERRFHPAIVATLVDITTIDPMPEQRWTYDGTTFTAPQ